MTPLESFTRLAAVGVRVEGLIFNLEDPMLRVQGGARFFFISNTHATALLEAEWHRKWPHWTCEQDGISGTWFVWDSDAACRRDDGNIGHADNYVCSHGKARTRLGAMVLAAEAKHKENA